MCDNLISEYAIDRVAKFGRLRQREEIERRERESRVIENGLASHGPMRQEARESKVTDKHQLSRHCLHRYSVNHSVTER